MADNSTTQSNCPPLSLADRLKIYAAKYLSGTQGSGGGTTGTGTQGDGEEVITTQANGTPLEATDYFRFRALSTSDSVAVTFYGRIYRKDKTIVPFSHELTTATANQLYETVQQATEGYLLGAAASVPINSITAGIVNAVGEIGRVQGSVFTPHTLLFSGQLDDLTPLSDSAGSITQPVSNGQIKFANNGGASGTEVTVTITPSNGRKARLTYATCTWANSAVAGERAYIVRLRQGGTTFWRNAANLFFQASETGRIMAAMGGNQGSFDSGVAGTGDLAQVSLPETLYLNSAFVVSILYEIPQAGDALTDLFVGYEEV